MAIRRSPHVLPLPALVVEMLPPPQALRPSASAAAKLIQPGSRRCRRAMRPSSLLLPPAAGRRGWVGRSGAPAVGDGPSRPVEHDAERRDRDAGVEALAEQVVLREAGDREV